MAAEFRRLSLGRIAWADRVDPISIQDPGLHKVNGRAIANRAIVIAFRRHAKQFGHDFAAIFTLEFQIMDRQNRLDVMIWSNPAIFFLEQKRHKRGMVVVAVQNVRHPIVAAHQFTGCLLKPGKPLTIIIVAVKLRPIKIVAVVQKHVAHAVLIKRLNATVLGSPTDFDLK